MKTIKVTIPEVCAHKVQKLKEKLQEYEISSTYNEETRVLEMQLDPLYTDDYLVALGMLIGSNLLRV